MNILNTPPYFIAVPPALGDLEVQFNSAVNQIISAADIKDDQNDPIFLYV